MVEFFIGLVTVDDNQEVRYGTCDSDLSRGTSIPPASIPEARSEFLFQPIQCSHKTFVLGMCKQVG